MENIYDIVSDLHIDQWNPSIGSKHPCGVVKNFPMNFEKKNPDSNILVVAGDISDNLDVSLSYLDQISVYYDKVLFVDGNHEHVHNYPYLFSSEYIYDKLKKLNNDKLIYLAKNHYVHKDTVFLGVCGWWDYLDDDEESKQESLDYFKEWIPEFTKNQNQIFINSVLSKSIEEMEYLHKWINVYENNPSIKKIVVVTHTIPHPRFCEDTHMREGCNSKFFKFFDHKKYSKLSTWIFGHTHTQYRDQVDDVNIICNPRGRPEDFNRENYTIAQSKL